MRSVLLVLTLIIVITVVLAGGLTFLAERHPIPPGHPLFAGQQLAEGLRLRITLDHTRAAELALDLADRRLADLAAAEEDSRVSAAGSTFAAALEQSVRLVAEAPPEQHSRLQSRLDDLLSRADTLVAQRIQARPPLVDNAVLRGLRIRLADLVQAEPFDALAFDLPADNAPGEIPAAAVSFLGSEVDHSFFPLDGGHDISCETCHSAGTYSGTPNQCQECHLPPDAHFPGSCSTCHLIADWTPYQFDHAGVSDCLSCHEADAPEDHFAGECVACHTSTTDWRVIAVFDHSKINTCAECHQEDAPAFHYPGECASCHVPDAWQQVTFNHAGLTDCISCHSAAAPANHYPGQCANCHTGTTDWRQVAFNHAGFTDCISCHSSNAPANHFPGQCSDCHTEVAWIPAQFVNHTFPLDHGSGVNQACTVCHTESYTTYTCYNCHEHEPADVREEHEEEGMFNFQDCVSCHPTGREDEAEDD